MEYLDIIDKCTGKKTGESKPRKQVHSEGDWHKGFHVWIINSKNELLLQRRSANKDIYPNKLYVSVAGHPVSNEDTIIAIQREFNEEIGFEIDFNELEYLFTFSQEVTENDGKFIDNMFYDVYLLEKDIDLSTLQLQKDEVKEVEYIDYKVLESMVKSKHKDIVNHPEEWEKLFIILHGRLDNK